MLPTKKRIGLILGPLCFLLLYFFYHPEGLEESGRVILAGTVWIAIWWISEALPISATALVPLVLFPLSGGMDIKQTAASYGHPIIFLFIGGFILALAMQKWQLHRRLALVLINLIGTNAKKVILGFMVATAFLSMWISNTATAIMMLPIGLAIIPTFSNGGEDGKSAFGRALMLGIAYSASLGGIATLIGTPPNLILAGVVSESLGIDLSFVQWLKVGLPFSVVMVFICWLYLTRFAFKIDTQTQAAGKAEIKEQLSQLGRIKFEEKLVGLVFFLTALAWICRSFLLKPLIPQIDDTIIAITGAMLLFILPASEKRSRLLDWDDLAKLPWGILLLFGGGIALAVGFDQSGLASWIGQQLNGLEGLSIFLLLLLLIAIVNFLTEITSNLATTAVILPILVPLALVVDVHPLLLMVGAAMAASCAFMLPVATPPNAIVFGSGYLNIATMMRAGIWLNLVSIAILSLLIYFLLPAIFGMELFVFPDALLLQE